MEKEDELLEINQDSLGLKRGLKLLTYFAEIFPKKYHADYLQDINSSIMNTKDHVKEIRQTHDEMKIEDFQWSADFIATQADSFDEVFNASYEECYLKLIFSEN
jgi:hypothetical protein